MSKKDKLAVYLTPEKKAELERRCHEDGSRSMTERGGVGLGVRRLPVGVLQQLLAVREVPHQRTDQLLLPLGSRTVIRHQLHSRRWSATGSRPTARRCT